MRAVDVCQDPYVGRKTRGSSSKASKSLVTWPRRGLPGARTGGGVLGIIPGFGGGKKRFSCNSCRTSIAGWNPKVVSLGQLVQFSERVTANFYLQLAVAGSFRNIPRGVEF